MGGLLHLFYFHQGSMGRRHKKQGSADVAAPRNSLEMAAETLRNHYAAESYEQDFPKRSYYPTDASMKKLISKDLSKQQSNKQNSPSIVARLMGMDLLPVDSEPVVQPRQDEEDKVEFIDKKVQLVEKVSSVRAPKKSKSSSKKEYRSYKDTYFRYWSSSKNLGKPRPRIHPQEKELQKFKKDFEAWQASRFLECARVVQLGNIPEQWLAQLDLTKEKMSIYETSRKDAMDKSGEHKRDAIRSRSLQGDDFERLGYKKDAFLPKHKESYSFSALRPGRDLEQNSLRDSDIGSERCRSLHRDDFERLGYKKNAFLPKHKESYSFSGVRSGRDLEQLSLRDSDIDSEKSSAPSKIVVLKPGPDSFSANDESWFTSSSSMDDRDCIEDLLEEVRERLRYEMQGNALNKGSMVRGGGIETPFKEKPAYERQTCQPVAKCVIENTNGDLGRKFFRSESARFYKNESLMSELAPSSPEYMNKDTKKFLSERLRNILDREKHPIHHLTSGGSPREPLFDDARVRLEKARDILNAEHGKHSWCDGNYGADTRARSFRYELKDDGNTQEQPSPRNLIRSLSAPVSGMSFGKLLLEDRYVSPGAHIKRKHEAFDKFSFDNKDQRKERFNLREKVSSLKHSLSLRRMLFSKKLESMDFSESNEFDSTKDIMNGPSVISSFNDRNDNSTELPPSPASICSSYQEEFWKPIDHTSPASISDVTSVEDHGVGNVFKDISSNLTELRKQLNQLDYEGSEISQITTVTEDSSESEMIELESEAEVYIKNLLVASGLYDGSWVKYLDSLTSLFHISVHQLKRKMAAAQLTAATVLSRSLPTFERLRPSSLKVGAFVPLRQGLSQRSFRPLVVKAATVVAPKYTEIKPLADRVLIKIKEAEEKTSGGILLPSTAVTKPQSGEVVAVGEGRTIGKNKVEIGVKTGTQVVYSKYAGTELEFNGTNHLLLKEDDIIGILETDEIKDLKPLNERVLIKVAEAEEKTAGGLLLTEASKEKPSVGTVISVGSGPLDEEGNRKPLSVSPGNTVMYSKYAGSEFKGKDGSDYIVLRASDVMAVLSS